LWISILDEVCLMADILIGHVLKPVLNFALNHLACSATVPNPIKFGAGNRLAQAG
jgi:hypothetical protein